MQDKATLDSEIEQLRVAARQAEAILADAAATEEEHRQAVETLARTLRAIHLLSAREEFVGAPRQN